MRSAVAAAALALGAASGYAQQTWVQSPEWHVVLASANRQGYLGVSFRDVGNDQVATLRLKDAKGAEIMLVDHDGPAGKAGLHEHDVILAFNNQPVDGGDDLRRMLHDTAAGRNVALLISRDGQQMTINVQMANRTELEKKVWSQHFTVPNPQGADQPTQDQQLTFKKDESTLSRLGDHLLPPSPSILLGMPHIGATLETMEPQLAEFFGVKDGKGLLVRSVDGNTPAAAAGLKAGDVVTHVNGRTVSTRNEFLRALRDGKGKPIAVVVLRDKKQQTLTLDLNPKKGEVDELSPREYIAQLVAGSRTVTGLPFPGLERDDKFSTIRRAVTYNFVRTLPFNAFRMESAEARRESC